MTMWPPPAPLPVVDHDATLCRNDLIDHLCSRKPESVVQSGHKRMCSFLCLKSSMTWATAKWN